MHLETFVFLSFIISIEIIYVGLNIMDFFSEIVVSFNVVTLELILKVPRQLKVTDIFKGDQLRQLKWFLMTKAYRISQTVNYYSDQMRPIEREGLAVKIVSHCVFSVNAKKMNLGVESFIGFCPCYSEMTLNIIVKHDKTLRYFLWKFASVQKYIVAS